MANVTVIETLDQIKLPKIVSQILGGYDRDVAESENGQSFEMLTNFPEYQLSLYLTAISEFEKLSKLVGGFAIHDDPHGFYEDEGIHFETSGYTLYWDHDVVPCESGDSSDLQDFWQLFKMMEDLPEFSTWHRIPV